jgi:acyl-CoA thioesterase FadM
MSLDALVVGTALPEYRVSAPPTQHAWENKIHEDGMAREFGFRGALVPGIVVYSWLTHPVVAALGAAWLDHGTFSVRFARPVYFDRPVTVRASVAAHSRDAVTIQGRVIDEEGLVCATATMGLPLGPLLALPDVASFPAASLPAERSPASRDFFERHPVLGTPQLILERAVADAFLERVREPLALYREADAPAHPGLYLEQANRALDRNVRVSPWIHVESHGQHLSAARLHERLETRARVKNLFQGKGHEFVELELLLLAGGARPVAAIRHVAIYQLRASG